MEGSLQPQLMLADNEAMKRCKNMEVEEKEVVKRMKISSQQPQLVLTEKEEHVLRFCETLVTDTVLDRTENQSWYDDFYDFAKKDDEKNLPAWKELEMSMHRATLMLLENARV